MLSWINNLTSLGQTGRHEVKKCEFTCLPNPSTSSAQMFTKQWAALRPRPCLALNDLVNFHRRQCRPHWVSLALRTVEPPPPTFWPPTFSVDRPTNVPDRPGLLYGLIWHEGEIKSSVFGIFQLGRVTCLMSCWEPATSAVRAQAAAIGQLWWEIQKHFCWKWGGKHLVYLLKDTTDEIVRIRVNGLKV